MIGPGNVPPASVAERANPSGDMTLLEITKSVLGPSVYERELSE